jgi:hypothetical protein
MARALSPGAFQAAQAAISAIFVLVAGRGIGHTITKAVHAANGLLRANG